MPPLRGVVLYWHGHQEAADTHLRWDSDRKSLEEPVAYESLVASRRSIWTIIGHD